MSERGNLLTTLFKTADGTAVKRGHAIVGAGGGLSRLGLNKLMVPKFTIGLTAARADCLCLTCSSPTGVAESSYRGLGREDRVAYAAVAAFRQTALGTGGLHSGVCDRYVRSLCNLPGLGGAAARAGGGFNACGGAAGSLGLFLCAPAVTKQRA